MGAEPLCTLRDCSEAQISDEEGFLPPVPGDIYSVDELVEYLRADATRPPHVLHMELPGRVRVVIAIGGPWGTVGVHHLLRNNWMPPDHPPSWNVVADQPPPVEYVA